jgi:hypothetical protein
MNNSNESLSTNQTYEIIDNVNWTNSVSKIDTN